MNVCVGMTRFNMVFKVGLVRTIKTAEVTTVRTGLGFFGVIMGIRKKTINLDNAGKGQYLRMKKNSSKIDHVYFQRIVVTRK